jgi:hypothetical protein
MYCIVTGSNREMDGLKPTLKLKRKMPPPPVMPPDTDEDEVNPKRAVLGPAAGARITPTAPIRPEAEIPPTWFEKNRHIVLIVIVILILLLLVAFWLIWTRQTTPVERARSPPKRPVTVEARDVPAAASGGVGTAGTTTPTAAGTAGTPTAGAPAAGAPTAGANPAAKNTTESPSSAIDEDITNADDETVLRFVNATAKPPPVQQPTEEEAASADE